MISNTTPSSRTKNLHTLPPPSSTILINLRNHKTSKLFSRSNHNLFLPSPSRPPRPPLMTSTPPYQRQRTPTTLHTTISPNKLIIRQQLMPIKKPIKIRTIHTQHPRRTRRIKHSNRHHTLIQLSYLLRDLPLRNTRQTSNRRRNQLEPRQRSLFRPATDATTRYLHLRN